MEVDGVAKADYWKVIDQCYLCDVCYMTKCPYVPPHPWNVDFPHLMLRAKAQRFRDRPVPTRDRLLTSTDAVGKLATIPVVVKAVNKANASPALRKVMQGVLGVAEEAWLPPYAEERFRSSVPPSLQWPVRHGARSPGKVAIFSTCYVNYNEPGIGHDLVKLLTHLHVPYTLVASEVCCGMPKLEIGDLRSVETLKNANIPILAPLARAGYAILTPVPSCTLMFKQELPLLFPEDGDVQAVSDAMFDPFEYFVLRERDGLLDKSFRRGARHRQLSHPLSFARAEHRTEDARNARVDSGHERQHRRTLRGSRRHVGREARVLRRFDENRQAGLYAHGGSGTRFHQLGLPDCRASHRAGHHPDARRTEDAQGASADVAVHRVRTRLKREGGDSRWRRSRATAC